jgi:hypothetical protein
VPRDAVARLGDRLAALREDEEFDRLLVDAGMIVQELGVIGGVANEGVVQQTAMFPWR